MEKNGQFMENYLFNRKFIASKTGLKMLCHVALICTIYCITDMICTVACQEIEVVRFLGSFHLCLFLSYVNQTTENYQKIIIRFGVPDFHNRRQISYHQDNCFLNYNLLLPPGMRMLKGGTVKKKRDGGEGRWVPKIYC